MNDLPVREKCAWIIRQYILMLIMTARWIWREKKFQNRSSLYDGISLQLLIYFIYDFFSLFEWQVNEPANGRSLLHNKKGRSLSAAYNSVISKSIDPKILIPHGLNKECFSHQKSNLLRYGRLLFKEQGYHFAKSFYLKRNWLLFELILTWSGVEPGLFAWEESSEAISLSLTLLLVVECV